MVNLNNYIPLQETSLKNRELAETWVPAGLNQGIRIKVYKDSIFLEFKIRQLTYTQKGAWERTSSFNIPKEALPALFIKLPIWLQMMENEANKR